MSPAYYKLEIGVCTLVFVHPSELWHAMPVPTLQKTDPSRKTQSPQSGQLGWHCKKKAHMSSSAGTGWTLSSDVKTGRRESAGCWPGWVGSRKNWEGNNRSWTHPGSPLCSKRCPATRNRPHHLYELKIYCITIEEKIQSVPELTKQRLENGITTNKELII